MNKDDKKFILYKASAGSGKTYTLVKEYLKIVLNDPSKFSRILAVTFTNKAAHEMKSRIIQSLKMIASLHEDKNNEEEKNKIRLNNGSLLKVLSEQTKLDELLLSKRSSETLFLILHHYSDFAVCTIDSYVNKLSRAFSFDLKIPQGAVIELDTKKVLTDAVDLLISYAGNDEELTSLLVDFMKKRMDDDQKWDPEYSLVEFSNKMLGEKYFKDSGLISNITINEYRQLAKRLHAEKKKLLDKTRLLANEICSLFETHHLGPEAFVQGKNGIGGFFQKLTFQSIDNINVDNSKILIPLESGDLANKKASATEKDAVVSITPRLTEAYYEFCSIKKQYTRLTIAVSNIYQMALLSRIKSEAEQLKSEGNIVFLEDFYKKIHEKLLDEPAPYIYHRTGEKYEHFFIDEFQDTSLLQFQNMLPLIENSLAYGRMNLMVGDGKQAIYRFRNGEVQQIVSLPDIYKKPDIDHFNDIEKKIRENFLEYNNYEPDTQNINYRSLPEIIRFNNEFFSFISDNLQSELTASVYKDIGQQAMNEKKGGYVKIKFLDENYYESQVQEVMKIINELKNYRPLSDIAVLCRSKENTHAISTILLSSNISIISEESLSLSASPALQLVISYLKHLILPDEKLHIAEVISILYNIRSKTDRLQQVFYKLSENESSARHFLSKILKEEGIEFDRVQLANSPIYDLCESLFRMFGIIKKPDPFITHFLDHVNHFSSQYPGSISAFLKWWDDQGCNESVDVPEGVEAVRVMTIHKAKGLEFPVVIIPYADSGFSPRSTEKIWVQAAPGDPSGLPTLLIDVKKELQGTPYEPYYLQEEELLKLDFINLNYVAFTRAEQELYILSRLHKNENTAVLGSYLMQFLKSKTLWEDGRSEYSFGDAMENITETHGKKSEDKPLPLSFISNSWHNKIKIRQRSVVKWDFDKHNLQRERGKLIHAILAEISSADDIEKVIKSFEISGVIKSNEAVLLTEDIKKLTTHPLTAKFFEKGLNVITESDIITTAGEIFRPDRLIINSDHAYVIDYKTGKPDNEHIKQLNNYATLFEQIIGKKCYKYLIYLHDEIRVQEV